MNDRRNGTGVSESLSGAIRVLQINSVNFGSTGTITRDLGLIARDQGLEVSTAYPASRSNLKRQTAGDLVIGNRADRNIHIRLGYITGLQGTFSSRATRLFLRRVSDFNPHVIHLHNMHDCYLNLPTLFDYIRYTGTPVVWTLHDCWALTGKCTHYTAVGCESWRDTCGTCPQLREYPATLVDRTETMHRLKKAWFADIANIVLVTPSNWLRSQVLQSHLRDYDVRVINNGIDLTVFKPTSGEFRRRHGIGAKRMVLGVSHGWSERKGLASVLEVRARLSSEYAVVLVGLSGNQIKELPSGVVGIEATKNAHQLAEIYTTADVFFNPSREDSYPTVNLEALACGTPVVAFSAGGAAEVLDDSCGIAVQPGDIASAVRGVQLMSEGDYRAACIRRVSGHGRDAKFREYVALYHELARRGNGLASTAISD